MATDYKTENGKFNVLRVLFRNLYINGVNRTVNISICFVIFVKYDQPFTICNEIGVLFSGYRRLFVPGAAECPSLGPHASLTRIGNCRYLRLVYCPFLNLFLQSQYSVCNAAMISRWHRENVRVFFIVNYSFRMFLSSSIGWFTCPFNIVSSVFCFKHGHVRHLCLKRKLGI